MASRRLTCLIVLGAIALTRSAAVAQEKADADGFRTTIEPFLKAHCIKCHGPDKQSGKLTLHNLDGEARAGRAAKWQAIAHRLTLGEMPPKKEPRPDAKDVAQVVAWIKSELKKSGTIARSPELDLPIHGNRVDHDALFDPKTKAPLEARPGIRPLSPEIYDVLIRDVTKGRIKYAQPFSSSVQEGFKDYKSAVTIDEPTTMQLIRNALAVAEYQTQHTIENGKVSRKGWSSQKEYLALLDPKQPPTDEQIRSTIRKQFDIVLRREPTTEELDRFVSLMKKNVEDAGRVKGVRTTLATVLLLPEVVFRMQLGQRSSDGGELTRLSQREIAFAVALALTDRRPDGTLLNAAKKGELATREQVAAQVQRILNTEKIQKPRILRFFHQYFGYDRAPDVFKDQKENKDHEARLLVADTDQLVEWILERDKDVFVELLTTSKSFVSHKWDKKKKRAEPAHKKKMIHWAYNVNEWPQKQPVDLPKNQRAGILTQPSWLVAYSANTENHAILRGKWIRERLLGGTVPDLPITVDAQLPEDPKRTLRERMTVTREKYCWQCHQRMNPLGLPFEQFDHFGRFRETELDKPVVTTGKIDNSGDEKLDGEVSDSIAMIRKLAKSERVRQVFVRHAFRYWIGRNEALGDARTLQEGDRAYVESGGSYKALVTSLLTSESFLYRAAERARKGPMSNRR